MTPPIVTAFYAGLSGLILIWLTLNVVRRRRDGRIVLGDGDDPKMAKAIRAHGNAAETIPLAMIMLGLAEMLGAPEVAIHLAGGVFVIGRILHGLHFVRAAPMRYRSIGMMMTLASMGLLSLGLVVHALIRIAA